MSMTLHSIHELHSTYNVSLNILHYIFTSQTTTTISPTPAPLSAQETSLKSTKGRMATDFSLRVPQGWGRNMCLEDREWIGHSLFASKGKLVTSLHNWWHPPPVQHYGTCAPSPATYHLKSLFLWMPRRMWQVDFHCPHCQPCRSLHSKGIYHRVRLVVDVKQYYYLAGTLYADVHVSSIPYSLEFARGQYLWFCRILLKNKFHR